MHRNRSAFVPAFALAVVVPALGLAACKSETPAEPTPAPERTTHAAPSIPAIASMRARRPEMPRAMPHRKVDAKPVATVPVSDDDPLKGKWTLADATKDIPGKGTLIAEMDTDEGKLDCALFEDKAPLTVANFVGLARGTRPWKDPDKKWVKKPAYDGTVIHRIIKGFMIQGGDAKGNGSGEPGYVVPDEIWQDANHDRPGLLCMANRGPNTNGAQFFITDGAAPHLDGGYTIFGECAPVDTVHKLASVETRGEKPVNPPKIKKVTIKRGPNPVPASSASAASSPSAAPSSSAKAPLFSARRKAKRPLPHEGAGVFASNRRR